MRRKMLQLFPTIMLVMFFSLICVTGVTFSQDPIYTDPANDQGPEPVFTDMRRIWIDDNGTHIMFKIELGGTWNQSGYAIYIYISTGSEPSVNATDANISQNYGIYYYADPEEIDFYDVNSSNRLNYANDLGLAYFSFSNNNQTLEIGYKLNTGSGGQGYLNLLPGQTIWIKIYSGGDTDVAPNFENNPISYTLSGGFDPLIILLIILVPVIGVALALIIYFRRKDK